MLMILKLGKVVLVLYFKCTYETMCQRVLRRGETSNRVDDNEETFHKRMTGFQIDALPVIEHFRQEGRLVTVSSSYDRI